MFARVAVDIPLPHLDRLFDYAIADEMAEQAVVGARVRVRFAGRQRNGFIVELAAQTEVTGTVAPLAKVVSEEPVLSAAQARLLRAVADHYAGTFSDVVRLAVPSRHATTERADQRVWPEPAVDRMPDGRAAGISGRRELPWIARGCFPHPGILAGCPALCG